MATLVESGPSINEEKNEDVAVSPTLVDESSSRVPNVGGSSEDSTTTDGPEEKQKMLRAARQIEFYLADSNLPFDRFMWALYTANDEHWIPITTLTSFKRMREFSSLGVEWVAKALAMSEDLEVNETQTSVRRRTEVQEPKGQFERSIYAKGFGKEEPDSQKRLEEFFNRYGQVNAVRMRRDDSKEFKGSAFVEFSDFKYVENFLKADPPPSWNGEQLLIMTKEAYCDMKMKEKGIKGKSSKETVGNRRGFNAFKLMEKTKNKGKSTANVQTKPDIWLEFMGNKIRVYDEDGGTVKDEDVPHVKGATLKFNGCGSDVHYNDIKNPLRERFQRVPFIKHSRGDDHGLLGFDKELSEEDIAFVKETVKTINSKDLTWSIPDGEEEKTFQLERAKAAAQKALGYSQSGNGTSRGGRGGRGGRGRGRGGRGGRGGGRLGGSKDGRKGKSDKQDEDGDVQTGEKRKRAVEPDGGPDTGVRGKDAPPEIQNTKKVKADAEVS